MVLSPEKPTAAVRREGRLSLRCFVVAAVSWSREPRADELLRERSRLRSTVTALREERGPPQRGTRDAARPDGGAPRAKPGTLLGFANELRANSQFWDVSLSRAWPTGG